MLYKNLERNNLSFKGGEKLSKDTKKQKTYRNIMYLFNKSEQLSKQYNHKYNVFIYIESLCHNVVLYKDPQNLCFTPEIGSLKRVIDENENSKSLKAYYLCVVKTNELIIKKHKNKSREVR